MKLTDGSVRARLFDLWLPMIGGIVAVKAIGLSDAYFVGQLGEQPLAAISFTFPIVMTLISLAIGLSAGASSVLSRAIGQTDKAADRKEIVTGSILMAVIVSAAISGFGFLLIEPVLKMLGASGQILSDAVAYMKIWFAGAVFLIVPIAINGLLRANGDGVSPALLMTGVAILNVSLNPIFIFGVGPIDGFGMQGAAVATITARAVSMLGAIVLIWRMDLLQLSWNTVQRGLGRWPEIARIGLPASLSTSLNPMALSIATAAVATLGSAEVAAFGIVTKIQSFAIVPLLALSSASSPFVGQNSGAGEEQRSRRGLYWCAGISIAWAVLIAIALFVGSDWLVSFFTSSDFTIQTASLYLMVVPLTYAGYGITIALGSAMNGLGRSFLSLLIGGGRAIGLLAPAAWIGVSIGGFMGLAIGTALANSVSGLVGLGLIVKHSLTTRGEESATECDLSESE